MATTLPSFPNLDGVSNLSRCHTSAIGVAETLSKVSTAPLFYAANIVDTETSFLSASTF